MGFWQTAGMRAVRRQWNLNRCRHPGESQKIPIADRTRIANISHMALQNRLIRKAVVPAAGLGTRHFPASHAVKKELFPIVGPDGINRALIHYHLRDLVAAGIEEICLIVQPDDDKPIRDYLNGPDDEYLKAPPQISGP